MQPSHSRVAEIASAISSLTLGGQRAVHHHGPLHGGAGVDYFWDSLPELTRRPA
jgi:hypothetical protein